MNKAPRWWWWLMLIVMVLLWPVFWLRENTTVENGVIMIKRLSVGWNLHPARQVQTFGLALSYAESKKGGKRWMLLLGPVTFIWLL